MVEDTDWAALRCSAATSTILFSTQDGTHRAQDNKMIYQCVLEGTFYACLAIDGRDVDLLSMQVYLFPYPLPVMLKSKHVDLRACWKLGLSSAVCCAV